MALQPAENLIAPAVKVTIAVLGPEKADAGLVALAQRYAAAIDEAPDRAKALCDLGPKLQSALESLGASPRARAALRGAPPSRDQSRLAVLRAARK